MRTWLRKLVGKAQPEVYERTSQCEQDKREEELAERERALAERRMQVISDYVQSLGEPHTEK